MNIYMDSMQVRKLAEEMQMNLDDFSNNIKELNNTIDNIGTAWSGMDATKYITTMKENNITELQRLHQVLMDYSKFLKNVPTAYETLDEVFTSKRIEI